MTTRPSATVSVPLRGAPVFGDAEYTTEPFPPPAAPERIVIHGASVEAVQEQSAGDVTLIVVPWPPPAGTESRVGDTTNVHDGETGACACETVIV